ncbi:hypothetical protein JW899_03725, partial [Candidatus Uhrbacteria bacterium]|nr:hypothetical protein [Candidatus Uhrbacteria bacterium]
TENRILGERPVMEVDSGPVPVSEPAERAAVREGLREYPEPAVPDPAVFAGGDDGEERLPSPDVREAVYGLQSALAELAISESGQPSETGLPEFGNLPETVRIQVRETVRMAMEDGHVPSVPGLTPVTPFGAERAAWRESAVTAGAETSGAVIVIDSDRNGLPDDLEGILAARGPETDDDPTVLAMVGGKPLEQPVGAGEIDESMAVSAESPGGAGETGVVLTGKCLPNRVCLVFVYSYVPLVLTTVADENGDFRYVLDDSLGDGRHTVYVALADGEGRIVRKSNPLSLLVREARAVSVGEVVLVDAAANVDVPIDRMWRFYLVGAIGLVTLAVAVAAAIVWRIRRRQGY